MDFRTKNHLFEKMKVLYDELYKPISKNQNQNQINNQNQKQMKLKNENNEKMTNLNKLLSAPVKIDKPNRTIYTLIEETKRKYLDYKTFLKIDDGVDFFNYKKNNNKYNNKPILKDVNKKISFNFSKNQKLKNERFKLLNQTKNEIEIKNEKLKKEIYNQLNGKWNNKNSNNITSINRTYNNIESSINSSRLNY